MRRATPVAMAMLAVLALASAASAKVLRVGTWHGSKGQYKTVAAAVAAAKANDWILVAPGDYKTSSSSAPAGHPEFPAGVLLTKPGLYLRGMNRNTVVVDGTKPGSPQCSSNEADQNFGPSYKGGQAGLNGIEIYKANNVWVQNLTVCNFLGGSGDTGNGVWWNGGANTYGDAGGIGGYGFVGSYLNATSMFFKSEATSATYGIFSSDWSGGTWDQTYASNFNDSGYYIGACQQVCNQTVNHAWAQYNALGYSGSNSGGRLLIENSQFDHNEDGFDTNSQNGDNPPPQDGSCPPGVKPPVAGAPTCWVFYKNWVHDNNNPNVPASGSAAAGPVGTGMSISGGRNDTVMGNTFTNNMAWAIILVPYPDNGPPCNGGMPDLGPGSCTYDQWGNSIINNMFGHNGGYGHPSNGDIAEYNFEAGHPADCYSGNTEQGGGSLSSDAAALQQSHPCGAAGTSTANGNSNPMFLGEVLCDSQVMLAPGQPVVCPSGPYPRRMQVTPQPLPTSQLKTMPNPCAGVPKNPWCPGHKHKNTHKH